MVRIFNFDEKDYLTFEEWRILVERRLTRIEMAVWFVVSLNGLPYLVKLAPNFISMCIKILGF
jgi:hypothetical protein